MPRKHRSMISGRMMMAILTTTTVASAQEGLGRIQVGAQFPLIELPSLADGTRTTVEAFRGKRVLAIVFASW